MFFLFFPIKKSFCEQDSGCWKEKRKENEEASMLTTYTRGFSWLSAQADERSSLPNWDLPSPLSPRMPLCVKGIFRDGLQVSLIWPKYLLWGLMSIERWKEGGGEKGDVGALFGQGREGEWFV